MYNSRFEIITYKLGASYIITRKPTLLTVVSWKVYIYYHGKNGKQYLHIIMLEFLIGLVLWWGGVATIVYKLSIIHLTIIKTQD